ASDSVRFCCVGGILGLAGPSRVRRAVIGSPRAGGGAHEQGQAHESAAEDSSQPSVHDSLLCPADRPGVMSASAGIPGFSTPSGFLTAIFTRNTRFILSFFVWTFRRLSSASVL